MNLSRKYLTLYVVIGSILIFSLKDALNLVHTALHAIPNPFHAHSFLPPDPTEVEHTHDASSAHVHLAHLPTAKHHHDVLDHLAYRDKKAPTDKGDQEEAQTASEVTWTVQAFFSYQLFQPYQLTLARRFFTNATIQLVACYPPSPPPEIS